ncbi:diacylglycerol kinase family protein [Xylophilus sp. Leaf220]|uniref:diacylglycerol/lipid kinase family protein n=1 Tax=Xylophilus sp. Leaf220 TaxID=1735686 RepID=UPI0006F3BDA9|nr:diacylglycerol kinase family protein [Xylophilus sp. Leaf220]KQM68496.1 diacylglycerol kinase [Xylophilus sp. Leaf220]
MPTPVLAPDAPIFLVLNAKSGKGEAMNAREVIERGCTAAGRMLHTFPIDKRHPPKQQARAAVAAARAAGGIVAVAGGDGTINATAQAVLGSGCAFGVLPQGTFNYFGRNHGIPTEIEGALEVLLTQAPQAVQVGQVNERVFLVNASMGLYATLLEDRETYKSQYGRNRLVALAAALLTLVRGHRPWTLRLSWKDEVQELRTTSLFVGNNALQFEQVGVAEGEALTQGALAAVVMKPQGLLARVGLLLRGALRRLDDAKTIDTLSFRALDVEPARGSRHRRVKVATDGELAWMEMPLRFQVAPELLWLIRPAASRVPDAAAARDTTA